MSYDDYERSQMEGFGPSLSRPLSHVSVSQSLVDQYSVVPATREERRRSRANSYKRASYAPSLAETEELRSMPPPLPQSPTQGPIPRIDRRQSQRLSGLRTASATLVTRESNRNSQNRLSLSKIELDPAFLAEKKGKEGFSPVPESNLVEFNGPDDPENPQNLPVWRKWVITVGIGICTYIVTFASSVLSATNAVTAEKFNVSSEVMILSTSLFVLGFAFGPLLWAPMSEFYGRKLPLLIGFFLCAIFQIPVAAAKDVATIMLCRFFAGFFGSSPFGVAGGIIADIWSPVERGVAMAAFGSATFGGPVLGPIIGGFIVESYLGWRWTEWLTVIMGLAFSLFILLAIPETSPSRILTVRAQKLRTDTQQWALHSKAEETSLEPRKLLTVYFYKPFQMLLQEPILDLISVYMASVYGTLYLLLEAFPISFSEKRGWSAGVGALPFLALIVGVAFGASFAVWYTNAVLAPKAAKNGGLEPEDRLPPMIIGGFLLPAGIFWFAWTSSPNITWVPQVLSGGLIGCGIILIFMQGLTYIVDVYLWHANSAMAANGILRALFGAAFPLFATAMFDSLGVPWASSVLGFIAAALVPVPILFMLYGKKIRAMSKFSPDNRPGAPPAPPAPPKPSPPPSSDDSPPVPPAAKIGPPRF